MAPVYGLALTMAKLDLHSVIQSAAVMAGADSSIITQWGPLVVALSGMIVAVAQLMSRRDKKQVDNATVTDARTNTALKGLEAYADRLEKDRAEWQGRAETAEAVVAELEAKLHPDPPPQKTTRPRRKPQ